MPESRKILIIEDEPDFYRDSFSSWIKAEIDTAGLKDLEDIERALEDKLSFFHPDVIILDLELLPAYLADESIKVLRYILKYYGNIPVLVVSKRHSTLTRGQILDLGGVDLIDKNLLLKDMFLLEKITSFVARQFTKSKWPFDFLEYCKIGITDDPIQEGRRIVEEQYYFFFSQAAFVNLLLMLIQNPRICPIYFFPDRYRIQFSQASTERLINLARSREKVSFKYLKNTLREGIKALYLQDVNKTLEISITEISTIHTEIRAASFKEMQIIKLEEILKQCIIEGKPPQDIPALRERFLEIYETSPEVLSEHHKVFFRDFIREFEKGESSPEVYAWFESRLVKGLFTPLLLAIAAGIVAWMITWRPSAVLWASAITFCTVAFATIVKNPNR